MSEVPGPLSTYREAVERDYGTGERYEVALRLMAAERELLRTIEDVLGEHQINRAQWSVLTMLFLTPSHRLPLGRIAQTLGVHGTTVTNAVDHLAKRGFADRAADTQDRRSIFATLKPEGEQVADTILHQLAERKFGLGSLTNTEVSSLSRLLRKVSPI